MRTKISLALVTLALLCASLACIGGGGGGGEPKCEGRKVYAADGSFVCIPDNCWRELDERDGSWKIKCN